MMSDREAALKAVNQTIADFGDDDPERSLDIEWGNVEIRVKHLETIRAALAEPEWRDISTAPKDGTTVLLFSNKNGLGWNITGYGRWEGGDDIVSGWVSFGMIEPGGNLGLASPTHWMPLPSPPKGKTP